MPRPKVGEDERLAKKQAELAPYIDAALARKPRMAPPRLKYRARQISTGCARRKPAPMRMSGSIAAAVSPWSPTILWRWFQTPRRRRRRHEHSVRGRVVVITGAGIGHWRRLCARLCREGRPDRARRAAPSGSRHWRSSFEALGGEALAVATDVTDEDRCQSLRAGVGAVWHGRCADQQCRHRRQHRPSRPN